jgi:hypothetical protein
MSNPAYLQNFGKLRKDMRNREVHDTMSASGRWDDLYLRASKPYIRKVGRRQSMPRDLKIIVQKGAAPLRFQPNGEVTTLLGFKCDPAAYKYKLDSPSYPSRSRELSQTDRVETHKPQMIPVAWKDVYASLRAMVKKIRFRDPAFTKAVVRDFQTLWPHRHTLKHAVALAKSREVFGLPDAGYEMPEPPKSKIVIEVKPKRKVAKSVYAEYEKIKKYLREIDRVNRLSPEAWDKQIRADRQEALRRQRVLLSIIEAGK